MPTDEYTFLHHAALTKLVRKFAAPPQFLGASFFEEAPVDGDTVLIDVLYGNRHMADYRHPDAPSGQQSLQKAEQLAIVLPCIHEKTKLPARLLKTFRAPGTEHTPWMEQKIVQELEGLDAIIAKRREYARWAMLTTGQVVSTSDFTFTVDFSIAATHTPTLTSTALWSDHTNSDPVSNFQDWKIIYAADADIPAIKVAMNSVTMKHLMQCANVRAYMGEAWKTQIAQDGRITRLCDLDIQVYDLGYVPKGGSFTKFLADGKVVLSGGQPLPEYVGIFPDLDATTPGRFSKSWVEQNPSGQFIMVGVNPLPSGERVEELFCATVL